MSQKYIISCAASIAMTINASFALPTITLQPTSQGASLFASARFSVAATGMAPLAYQWQFNNTNISGGTANSLTLTNIQRSDSGSYSVLVSDISGSVTSRVATLTIVPFQALYCFGFSWTATRDTVCGWGYPNYYKQQACNGPMWPEFLSTNLDLVYVAANNLAVCGADSTQVLNQINQLPRAGTEAESLYILWAGDSEFLYAASTGSLPTRTIAFIPWTNNLAWDHLIQTSLGNTSNAVERLYARGARSIVVQNNFDLSKFPYIISEFGTNAERSTKLTERTTRFNLQLKAMSQTISDSLPDIRLMVVDIQSGLSDLIANPGAYGFTKTFPSALDDSSLSDKSFNGPGADYVFWDSLHPTSKTQSFIADWTLNVVLNTVLEELDGVVSGSTLNLRAQKLQIGRDYTLQQSPDLRNWSDVGTFTAAFGTNLWPIVVGNVSASYFRLRQQ